MSVGMKPVLTGLRGSSEDIRPMQAAQVLWVPGPSTNFQQSHAPRCQAASACTWAHPGGLAGELRTGKDIMVLLQRPVPQVRMDAAAWGRAALREDGQKDKKEWGQTHFLPQRISGKI